jgi:hypothetical protein
MKRREPVKAPASGYAAIFFLLANTFFTLVFGVAFAGDSMEVGCLAVSVR